MSTTFVVIFVHLSKAKLRQLGIKMYRTWFRTLEQKVIHNFEEFQLRLAGILILKHHLLEFSYMAGGGALQ